MSTPPSRVVDDSPVGSINSPVRGCITIWKDYFLYAPGSDTDAFEPAFIGGYTWIGEDNDWANGIYGQCNVGDFYHKSTPVPTITPLPRHELPISEGWNQGSLVWKYPLNIAGHFYRGKMHYDRKYEAELVSDPQHRITEGSTTTMPICQANPGTCSTQDSSNGNDECYDTVVASGLFPGTLNLCAPFESPSGGTWNTYWNGAGSQYRNTWGTGTSVDLIGRSNQCVKQIVEALRKTNEGFCSTVFTQVMLRETEPSSNEWEPYTQHMVSITVDETNMLYTVGRDSSFQQLTIPPVP